MNARFFDMFHDPSNIYIIAITQGINISLAAAAFMVPYPLVMSAKVIVPRQSRFFVMVAGVESEYVSAIWPIRALSNHRLGVRRLEAAEKVQVPPAVAAMTRIRSRRGDEELGSRRFGSARRALGTLMLLRILHSRAHPVDKRSQRITTPRLAFCSAQSRIVTSVGASAATLFQVGNRRTATRSTSTQRTIASAM